MSRKDEIRLAREKLKRGEPTDAQLLAAERKEAQAKAARAEQLRIRRALEKEVAFLERRQAYIDALAEAPTPKPMKIRKKPGQGKRLPAATYVMLASDWHYGERVRPGNVGHRNEYDLEIAQERATQFFESQLTMLTAARSAWDIRDGVLWFGGDLQAGYIHEEYLEENFLSPTESILALFKVLVRGIDFLLDRSDLEEIRIPCNFGNHGRTGEKMKVASSARNSFEWLLYQFLRWRYQEEPRLKWQIASGYNVLVDCYGFRINFHHGEAVRYNGGLGGISVPMNRRIGRRAQSIPVWWEGTSKGNPHLDVSGHHHYLEFPGQFVKNGSLIGWNDFAEKLGCAYQDPLQASFVVDELYRLVSNFNPILVEPRKRRRRRWSGKRS